MGEWMSSGSGLAERQFLVGPVDGARRAAAHRGRRHYAWLHLRCERKTMSGWAQRMRCLVVQVVSAESAHRMHGWWSGGR